MQNKNSDYCAPITSFDWNKEVRDTIVNRAHTFSDVVKSRTKGFDIGNDQMQPIILKKTVLSVLLVVG